MSTGKRKVVRIPLDFLPKRPRKTTAILLNVSFSDAHRLVIDIRDAGFGDLFPATDARIRRAFQEEIPDTTRLIIAQRISSVQECDRIIVMDNGRVSGFGTHEELLADNQIYREVYESQTGIGADADFDRPA